VPASRPPLSIVVLPFDNLSGDPEQGYLADAITDDLTTDLSRIAGSFVISRNSAFTYKGKPVDVKQVGRELGVQYALEGSVRRAGNRVRINAQLIETESGAHVWADRFDREMGDMLALQDDITGSIARVLRYELIEAESRRSLRERPANPQAIDYALRAVATTMRDPMIARENARAARQLYEEALRLDPKLLMAMTGLAQTWMAEVSFGWTQETDSALGEAETLIARAEAIAPNDARVLQGRGIALLLRRKPELALVNLEAALARDPNSTQILLNIGWCKMFLGDPEGAVVHVGQALRLDPRGFNRGNMHGVLGTASLYLGNYDEAIHYLRLSIEEYPTIQPFVRWVLAAACALAGRMDEARMRLSTNSAVCGPASASRNCGARH
jgi:TolB-like protein